LEKELNERLNKLDLINFEKRLEIKINESIDKQLSSIMPDILNRYQELINNYTSISESNELFS
jgi:hypothetical protein